MGLISGIVLNFLNIPIVHDTLRLIFTLFSRLINIVKFILKTLNYK